MVYKKYIKRNGKVYGPYNYHSRRVNGKVVSEYRGGDKKIDYKKFVVPVLGVLFLALFMYAGSQFEFPTLSGNVVLDFGATYQEGQALAGKLDLFLNEGEFIPANSKVIFETENQFYEYSLRDVVSDQIVKGEYYLDKNSLSGYGDGFGQLGIKETYPIVYFEYNIYSSSEETPIEPVEEFNVSEETSEEEVVEPVEEISEEPIVEPSEPAPGLPDVISNFFLALTPTGNVVAELGNIGDGQIIYGESFVIDLLEGQSIEIIPNSVYTETSILSDDILDLVIGEDSASIITSYIEEETGFGKDYLGSNTKQLSLNLNDLSLVLDQGDLKISVLYEEKEIVSISTVLGEGYVEAKEGENNVVEIPEEPKGPEEPTKIITPEITIPGVTPTLGELPLELTNVERIILENKFGETEKETSKEKLDGNRILIRYQLGEYVGEFVYDSSLSKEDLAEQIHRGEVLWLKEVANSI
jgi:hypothetical protein